MLVTTGPSQEDFPGAAGGFRRALDAADIGLWRWEPATGAVQLSRRACALLGCPETGSIDYAAFTGLIHPDDRSGADTALRDSVATFGAFDFVIRTTTSARRVRVRGRADRGEHENPEVSGILIESIRRTAAEEKSSRLASIVTSSDDAIVGKTLDGIVTDWNSGAEAIFGYPAAEAIGRPLTMLLPPGQEDEMVRILDRIRAGERVEHYETRRRRKDGEIIEVSLTISPIWDSSGRLSGASKVARDITATKRARVKLQESEAHLRSVMETVTDATILPKLRQKLDEFCKRRSRPKVRAADDWQEPLKRVVTALAFA